MSSGAGAGTQPLPKRESPLHCGRRSISALQFRRESSNQVLAFRTIDQPVFRMKTQQNATDFVAVGLRENFEAIVFPRTIVTEMKRKIAEAQSRLQTGKKGLRILYLAPGNFTAGANTSIHEILCAAGFRNAAAEAGVNGNVKIASEQIMQIDPDLILIATGYARDRGFRQRLESEPQLSTLGAIRGKRVVELPARSVLTVSQYAGDAVLALVTAVNQLSTTKGGER